MGAVALTVVVWAAHFTVIYGSTALGSQLPDFLAFALGGLGSVAVLWEASALFFVPRCA
ncbi:MAG: hypothetical protein ACT4P4_26300 [Betaproteobacteria bacterium]